MLEAWRDAFRRDGEVEIRMSRRTAGLAMFAVGLAFGVIAAYLLLSPGMGRFPVGVLRFAGICGALLALVGLGFGGRNLVAPMFLARLNRHGLVAWRAPLARWDEVVGVRVEHGPGVTMSFVRLSAAWWERVEREDPERAAKLRRDRDAGEDEVRIPFGAPGGAETLRRFVLWAQQEAQRA